MGPVIDRGEGKDKKTPVQELGAEDESKGDSADTPRSQDSDGRAERHSPNPGKRKFSLFFFSIFFFFFPFSIFFSFKYQMHRRDTLVNIAVNRGTPYNNMQRMAGKRCQALQCRHLTN
jgi:hypothetical protein